MIGFRLTTDGGAVSIVCARQRIEASMTPAVCTKAPVGIPATGTPPPQPRRGLRSLVRTLLDASVESVVQIRPIWAQWSATAPGDHGARFGNLGVPLGLYGDAEPLKLR